MRCSQPKRLAKQHDKKIESFAFSLSRSNEREALMVLLLWKMKVLEEDGVNPD